MKEFSLLRNSRLFFIRLRVKVGNETTGGGKAASYIVTSSLRSRLRSGAVFTTSPRLLRVTLLQIFLRRLFSLVTVYEASLFIHSTPPPFFLHESSKNLQKIDGLKKDSFIPLIPIVNPFMNNYGLFPTDRHLILRGLTWENLERLNPTSAASFIADIYRRLKKNDGIKKLFLPGIFSPRELRESVYMCVFASETRFYVYLFKQHALFLPPGIPISRRQWEEGAKRNVWRISGPIHYIYI